ncbi:MAG: A/G-specific adenine glycosylase [Planctomycetes bacterium]|nr:A/G-specific adenine glycosylase [Planctomycetota bacterium]
MNDGTETDFAGEWSGSRLGWFRRCLLAWYQVNARDLPWRQSRDPYQIWISEIMLQQTTVAVVVPYFERFIGRFPNVSDLAAADEDDVLRHWEGLGYYSRARNIHKAARVIVERDDGEIPVELNELSSLPGIGRYTAGAISSMAFDRPAAIVEANTLRLYCRLLGFQGDPRTTAGREHLWRFADHLLPRSQPGRFNQALMELGALQCRAKSPACRECPVRQHCRALGENLVSQIPLPPARPQVESVTEAVVAVRRRGRYLIRRCGNGERWAGLWDFARVELKPASDPLSPADIRRIRSRAEADVRDQSGITIRIGKLVSEFRHQVTRFRIRSLCFLAECESGRCRGERGFRWVPSKQFDDYPFSVTGRKFAQQIRDLRDSPLA